MLARVVHKMAQATCHAMISPLSLVVRASYSLNSVKAGVKPDDRRCSVLWDHSESTRVARNAQPSF